MGERRFYWGKGGLGKEVLLSERMLRGDCFVGERRFCWGKKVLLGKEVLLGKGGRLRGGCFIEGKDVSLRGKNTPYGQQRFSKKNLFQNVSSFFISDIFFAN